MRLLTYGRAALVVTLVAGCVVALVASWSDVAYALPRVGWFRFGLSTVVGTLAGVALAVGWRILLAELVIYKCEEPIGAAGGEPRHRVGLAESIGVYSASQLGKYVPGSVWPMIAQMSFSRRHQIARRSIVAAFVSQLLILIVTAVVVATITLSWNDPGTLRTRWWLMLLAPAMCCVLVPQVQRHLLATAGRVLHRDLTTPTLGKRAMTRAAAVSTIAYSCFGVHLATMGWPLIDDPSLGSVVHATGAFALAWTAGIVVVFAPAGIGVRDLVLALTLSTMMSAQDATALAMLSRASVMLADLTLGIYGLISIHAARQPATAMLAREQTRGRGPR